MVAGVEEQAALEMEGPIAIRTNEPKALGVNVFNLIGILGGDAGEFAELRLFGFAALGLNFAKLLEGLEKTAGEALLVERESEEGIRLAEGFGENDGGVGFGVGSVPGGGVFVMADGEEIVLGGGEAMEAELEIGTGVSELGFQRSDGLEGGDEAVAEFGVDLHFLFGQVNDLRENTMAGGVERGALLTAGGARAGTFLSVEAISAETGSRGRGWQLLTSELGGGVLGGWFGGLFRGSHGGNSWSEHSRFFGVVRGSTVERECSGVAAAAAGEGGVSGSVLGGG